MTVHGGVEGVPVAAQVAGSLTVAETAAEVRTRKSAVPEGAGNVVIVVTRIRRRVTGAPVLFITRRRTESVPTVELFAGSGVRSVTRFGGTVAETVVSSNTDAIWASRALGLLRL